MKTKELLKNKAPFLAITGPAGSGKTFLAREAINLNPKWGVLTATTGAAARVLGTNVTGDVKTVHSTLGFFDAESLRNSRDRGTLRKNLKRLRKKFKRIVIDESSMLDSEVFEIIVIACEEVGIGIVLIGDFLQLPAIPPTPKPNGWTQWLFQTPSWEKFKNNVIILDTQYRHTNEHFLKGLNLLRAGKGEAAIPYLKKAGVEFVPGGDRSPLDLTYKGTTIVGTNELRDKINAIQYNKLSDTEVAHATKRSGFWTKKEWQEWKDVPDSVGLKLGTRVMVLRNLYGEMILDPTKKVDTDAADTQTVLWNADGSTGVITEDNTAYMLLQANGDTGIVEAIGANEAGEINSVDIRRDDGALIQVGVMKADNGKYHTEIDEHGHRVRITDEEPTAWIEYFPVTKAWALTTHKSQGLTIVHPTRVVCEDFFRKPAMVYVACSRVKNPTDLTIVGAEYPVNGKPWLHWLCKTDPAVSEWIGGNHE